MTRVSRAEAAAQTRAMLLDAAAVEFAEKGFAGASLDAIAERAGRTKGAVYSNFENKSELFMAVLDRHLNGAFAELESRLSSVDDVNALIEGVATLPVAGVRRDRESFLLLWEFRLYALRNPEVRERLAERTRASRAAIEGQIEASLKNLDLAPPLSPARLAVMVQCLEAGIELFHNLEPDGPASEVLADSLRLVLAAASSVS